MASSAPPPPVELQPGDEATDQRVSAVDPIRRYLIQLNQRAEVTVLMKENNTASRCVVYLSNSDSLPTAQNATWKSETSDPKKSITVLPIDPEWRDGPCFIVVRYVASSGAAHFSLQVMMHTKFQAVWSFPDSLSVYEGDWQQDRRHGTGRCIYYANAQSFDAHAPQVTRGSESLAAAASRLASKLLSNEIAAASLQPDFDEGTAADADSLSNRATKNQRSKSPTGADAAAAGASSARPLNAIPNGGAEYFQGTWIHGFKDGFGSYTWPDKCYEGYWRQGRRYGKGTLTRNDGSLFSGEWRDDVKCGYGVQHYTNGTRYEGEWAKNRRHGKGVFFYGTGITISGTWKNDILTSEVNVTYPNGEQFQGGWQNDMRHGHGVLKEAEGHTYDGDFIADQRHGNGVWYLPRSVKYVGVWDHNVRKGELGRFIFPSTDVYVGQWDEQRHVRHGQGSCQYANGDAYEGGWEHDERSGRGVLSYDDGTTIYEGEFAGNVRSGEGKCTNKLDSMYYEGAWLRDQRHGKGMATFPDGSTYKGEWLNDLRHGHGVMEAADKSWRYDGCWDNDVREGNGVWTLLVIPTAVQQRAAAVAAAAAASAAHQNSAAPAAVGATPPPASSIAAPSHAAGGAPPLSSPSAKPPHPANASDVSAIAAPPPPAAPSNSMLLIAIEYNGEWSNDARHGEGTAKYLDGSSFSGRWQDNVRLDGRGTMTYPSGDEYSGIWKHEMRHGKGTARYHDGTRFEGDWLHGECHGEGVFTNLQGDAFHGRWVQGRRQDGYGKCVYANGNVYEGEWKGEKPHGQGMLTYMGDDVSFEGKFVDGEYRL